MMVGAGGGFMPAVLYRQQVEAPEVTVMGVEPQDVFRSSTVAAYASGTRLPRSGMGEGDIAVGRQNFLLLAAPRLMI